MTGRVARRAHDLDASPWLGITVDLLEGRARKVRDMWQVGVVVLLARVRELALLHEDRSPCEMAVAAGMVGMEVAVRDELHVGDAMARGAKRLLDGPHVHGLVEVDHLPRLRRETGVEEEHAARMLDDERRHDDPLARKALAVGGHRVVPGMDGLDPRVSHLGLTVAA